MSVRAAPSPTALSPRAEHPDLLQARPAETCRVASHHGDDSAIVTALPEEQLMPLSRLNDGFEIELEGIAFGMVDRQGHRWRCKTRLGAPQRKKIKLRGFAPTVVLLNESSL